MKVMAYMKMPFSYREGWRELQAKSPSIPLLAWCVVLPMSLLPPLCSTLLARIMAMLS